MKTAMSPLWPVRSRERWEAAKAGVRSPQVPNRPATGQDREADPAVRFSSKWEHRSKEAYSVPAIGPWRASRPKPLLWRPWHQPSGASGPYVEGCILSQTHLLSNLAQFAGPPVQPVRRALRHPVALGSTDRYRPVKNCKASVATAQRPSLWCTSPVRQQRR